MPGGNNKTPVTVKCARCGTEFTVPTYHYKRYMKAGKNFYCKECYKINRSAISKNVWKEMDPEKRKAANDKKAETRRNRSEEEKKASRIKTQNTWANKSEEEMKAHSEARRKNIQTFWDSLDQAGYKEMCDKIAKGQRKHFDLLTDEEKEKQIAILHDGWNNWFKNLTPEQREAFDKRIDQYSKPWWDVLSDEEYLDFIQRQIEGYAGKANQPNENELVFQDHLNRFGFTYQFQTSNKKIHPEFDKLFPSNPITGKDVSPYHRWDYMVITLESNVLVDIDGSVHDPKNKTTGITEFNDSKRPYQTDGLPAYAVLCYDDDIKESTPVKNITTGEIMPFKAFITLLRMMNMTKKEQRKVLNL